MSMGRRPGFWAAVGLACCSLPWMLLAGCTEDFHDELRRMAVQDQRDPDCVEAAVRARWPDPHQIYEEARRIREPRARQEVTRHAILQVSALCPQRAAASGGRGAP